MTHPPQDPGPAGSAQAPRDAAAGGPDRWRAQAEENLLAAYMDMPLAYDSLDPEGRVLNVNQAWLDLLGYRREEVIGRWIGDFFDPELREELRQVWPTLGEMRIIDRINVSLRRKDGTPVDVLLQGRVSLDEDGRIVCTHCLTQDITVRKRTAEALGRAEREKALILDIISDGVVYHDAGMRVVWANRDPALPYAAAQDPVVGEVCHRAAFGRATPCEGCPVALALETGRPESGEVKHLGRSYEIRGIPVRNQAGVPVGAVQVTTDITERRQLEGAVLDASALERARLGRDLHDGLGQMLTGLSFMASALHDRLAASGHSESAEVGQLADLAAAALRQARTLAKGLVPLDAQGGDLLEVLMDAAAAMEALFQVQCRVQGPAGIREPQPGSFHHLRNVIQEAVCNAVKHGHARSVRITVERSEDRLGLTVQNDGAPLSAQFRQAKGLGLKVMGYRVSALGGSMAIGNAPEGGVAVRCSFPWPA